MNKFNGLALVFSCASSAFLAMHGGGGVTGNPGGSGDMVKKPVCKKEVSKACSGCSDGTMVVTCASGNVFASCSATVYVSCSGSGHTCAQASGGSACGS